MSLDPLSYFSRPISYVPRRMVAYRLDDGQEQPVVDAPDDAMPGAAQRRSDRLWLGRSVVLAGTHLPTRVGRTAEPRSQIIEYWPDSGRWEAPMSTDSLNGSTVSVRRTRLDKFSVAFRASATPLRR